MAMTHSSTTLLVIGGGPGGYVAAIRAGQLGIPTVLVEGADLGGTCLNIGCIPSKALIHAADAFHQATSYAGESPRGIRTGTPTIAIARTVAWKDAIVGRLTGGVGALLKKNGVRVVNGWARILDGKTVEVDVGGEPLRIRCEHLLLATGSQPVELTSMPFGGNVVSSTEVLAPSTLPDHLVVVGAGYIGLELGIAYRKLGARVTIVESAGRVLPAYDEELVKPVAASLKRLGIAVHLEASVLGLAGQADKRAGAMHRPRHIPPALRTRSLARPRSRTSRALLVGQSRLRCPPGSTSSSDCLLPALPVLRLPMPRRPRTFAGRQTAPTHDPVCGVAVAAC